MSIEAGNRLAHDGPMRYVYNPPGDRSTPFPSSDILKFDLSIGARPSAMHLCGRYKVITLIAVEVDSRRLHNVNLRLAEAELENDIPSSLHPNLLRYTVHRSGSKTIWLLERITRELLSKIIRILYEDYSFDMGHSTPFTISPSMHQRILSYEEWRTIHLGEMCGEFLKDSYRVYEWFLGCPHVGNVPVPIYNYFQGWFQASRV